MLPICDLAEVYGPIPADAFADFVESVRRNGLREKIVTYKGYVIDGVNRQEACRLTGRTPSYREWEPPDPEASEEQIRDEIYRYIRDKNDNRRHETTAERAIRAAKMRGMITLTVADAAKDHNVSPRLVNMASNIIADGIKDLVDAVKQVAIPVSVGEQISKLPVEEQPAAIVEAKERKKKPRKPKSDKPKIPEPIFNDGPDLTPKAKTVTDDSHEAMMEAVEEAPAELTTDTVSSGVSVPNGALGGYSAPQQKQWRQSFFVQVKMLDDWLDLPAQKRMKVKANELHAKGMAELQAWHARWDKEMNPGGQWS